MIQQREPRRDADRGPRAGVSRGRPRDGEDEGGRRDRPARSERGARPSRRAPEWEVTRLYIGAGRKAGVRPGDLVGAIANEVGIDASVIGAIEIADRFSLVEVPEEISQDIIDALRNTTIKGKRVVVRRDQKSA